jgi:NAD(P)-dependent dehydrogenase (short-subunit alcohol dehydrogenase family)
VFAVNVLAPYLLTGLITRPDRLIYLAAGMARGGDANLSDPQWIRRSWSGMQAYSDSKLFDAMLSAGVARRWPHVLANSVEPGWVPTKMGGRGAPDDLSLARRPRSGSPPATMLPLWFPDGISTIGGIGAYRTRCTRRNCRTPCWTTAPL